MSSLSTCSRWNAISSSSSLWNRLRRKRMVSFLARNVIGDMATSEFILASRFGPLLALGFAEYATDCRNHLFELRDLDAQLLAARRGECIKAGAAVGVGHLPLSLDPSL